MFVHKGGKKKCGTWSTFHQSVHSRIWELCMSDSTKFGEIFNILESSLHDCDTCYQRGRRWRKLILAQRDAISFL